jgi:hypothetical protein
MDWIQRNFKTIIYISFLVPILTVAFVSISHVTTWYGLSNPMTWAIYLSVGIEIAALSALAAISAQMGRKVYVPFGIVTLIQFIGNIFFAYQFIDVNSEAFKDWVDLVDPFVSYLGVESGDMVGHKRFLALFSGGMLPIISLSFLHMLVKFEEEEKNKKQTNPELSIDELSILAGREEAKINQEKYTPTEEDIKSLEEELRKLNEAKFGVLLEEEPKTESVEDVSQEIYKTLEEPTENSSEKIDEVKVEIEPDFYLENEPEMDFYNETPQPTISIDSDNNEIKRLSYKRSH